MLVVDRRYKVGPRWFPGWIGNILCYHSVGIGTVYGFDSCTGRQSKVSVGTKGGGYRQFHAMVGDDYHLYQTYGGSVLRAVRVQPDKAGTGLWGAPLPKVDPGPSAPSWRDNHATRVGDVSVLTNEAVRQLVDACGKRPGNLAAGMSEVMMGRLVSAGAAMTNASAAVVDAANQSVTVFALAGPGAYLHRSGIRPDGAVGWAEDADNIYFFDLQG